MSYKIMRRLEPHWLSPACVRRSKIPAQLRQWLWLETSMTEKLKQSSQRNFLVELVSQCWQQPRLSERQLLNLSSREPAMIREVRLWVDQQIWIFARSVLPKKLLTGKYISLRHLNDKPLGEIIFQYKQMQRNNLQIAKLRPGHVDYHKATLQLPCFTNELWARRSLIKLGESNLLINEIFLPVLYESKFNSDSG